MTRNIRETPRGYFVINIYCATVVGVVHFVSVERGVDDHETCVSVGGDYTAVGRLSVVVHVQPSKLHLGGAYSASFEHDSWRPVAGAAPLGGFLRPHRTDTRACSRPLPYGY